MQPFKSCIQPNHRKANEVQPIRLQYIAETYVTVDVRIVIQFSYFTQSMDEIAVGLPLLNSRDEGSPRCTDVLVRVLDISRQLVPCPPRPGGSRSHGSAFLHVASLDKRGRPGGRAPDPFHQYEPVHWSANQERIHRAVWALSLLAFRNPFAVQTASADGIDFIYGSSGWHVADIPIVIGSPDVTGDAILDVWALKSDGNAVIYPGSSTAALSTTNMFNIINSSVGTSWSGYKAIG